MATKLLVISKGEGRSPLTHSFSACGEARPTTMGESLLAVALFEYTRVSVSYFSRLASNLSRLEKGRLAASLSRRVR